MKKQIQCVNIFLLVFLLLLLISCVVDEKNGDATNEDYSYSLQDISQYKEPEKLATLIEDGEPEHVLIDVRTPSEHSEGHIPTAVNIPLSEIEAQIPDIPPTCLTIVYCRSGGRSKRAAEVLLKAGFEYVVDFGGIYRWTGEVIKSE